MILHVFIVLESGKEKRALKAIKSMNHVQITAHNSNEIVVKLDNPPQNKSKQTQIKNSFTKIPGVLQASLVPPYLAVKNAKRDEAFRTNKCGIFFDIDSTLTQGAPGTIHPKIKKILQQIQDRGIWIFFATGRSMPDVINLITNYPAESHAIAENGGLILGFGKNGYMEFGNRDEPDKVLNHLKTKYRIPEDMRQGIRLTEVIFLQRDVSRKHLDSAIKHSNAKVDVHPSTNSYHISQTKINKGTAMLKLCELLHFNRFIIAVGDADMDIPMFEKADYSFAVGNASPNAKNAANQVLDGEFEKGIEEIYNLINRV